MVVSKRKRQTLKARAAKSAKASKSSDRDTNTIDPIVYELHNEEIEFHITQSSANSQYLPSQTDDDDSYFRVVLEQLLGFFIEKFGSNWKNLVNQLLNLKINLKP